MPELTGVTEHFSPPSSLPIPFDDLSQNEEIYSGEVGRFAPLADAGAPRLAVSAACPETEKVPEAKECECASPGPHGPVMASTSDVDLDVSDADWDYVFNSCRDAASNETEKLASLNELPHPFPPEIEPGLLPSPESINLPHPKPFARAPFPSPVPDRPCIVGLSSSVRLRTCFRIGEALREAARALRSQVRYSVVVELYARVLYSARDGDGSGIFKQTFQFGDLFHDRGPYLNGVCKNWKQTPVGEVDSRVFLDRQRSEKMARVVLSVWEASWEDVAHVRGIVCAPPTTTTATATATTSVGSGGDGRSSSTLNGWPGEG
ncbi:MAG: hypothetical protein M1826_003759 [Phylliscum demangeonii]|nr:MAG: hypothetical protein M1826_003759 [Phylliscum demangeonii]